MLIFDREKQDVNAGGSGCGCSATVTASHFYPRLRSGELHDMLLIGTGALLSAQNRAAKGIDSVRGASCTPEEDTKMTYVYSFLVGGLLCVVAQVLIDKTKITPAYILVGYVCTGVLLSAVGLYEPFKDFAAAARRCR